MFKILVIGEKCIDRFMYCDVSRFSPEAPVPVLNPIEIVENDGMAGNVVRNILSMKSDSLVSHWYQDEIITKTRFVEKKSNHMFLRLDEGESIISKADLNNEREPQSAAVIKKLLEDIYSIKAIDLSIVRLIRLGSIAKIINLEKKRKHTINV